ncbi:phosphoglycerate mutase-like protein, partial [Russula earlei]
MSVRRKYEAILDFFDQDEPSAVPRVIEPTPEFFGLTSKSWPKFKAEIDKLRSKSTDPGVSYKVFFFGRHGQAFHNFAFEKYGRVSGKWALKDGDGTLIWGPDPRLTETGEEQARNAHAAWEREIARDIQVPQRFYCSPLTRALRTLELTFPLVHPQPIVLENCREHNSGHTCDKRRTQSALQDEFPNFVFEEGFEQEDVFFSTECETEANLRRRAELVLDRIFENDNDTYVSVTAHFGWIKAVLHVIGRENSEFFLPNGG